MATALSFRFLILGIVFTLRCAFSTAHSLAGSDSSSSNIATLIYHIMGDLYELQSENKLMAERIEFLEGKLESQETSDQGQSQDQADKIELLETKLELLEVSAEGKIEDQADKINRLEDKLTSAEGKIDNQADQIKMLEGTLESTETSAEAQIQNQAGQIKLLEQKLTSAEEQSRDQVDKIKLLEEKLELLETSAGKTMIDQATKNEIVEELESSLAKVQTSTYAFSAYEISDTTPSTGDTLVFTKTFVNENGAYSTTTGIYTAPCDGIYEFHATIALSSKNTWIAVEFKAGTTAIGKFPVGDYWMYVSSSGSAIALVTKGTEVFLRVTGLRSSGARLGDDTYRMNSFSGHLISK